MSSWNLLSLLDPMSNDYFELFKKKIAENCKLIASNKGPTIPIMMDVLCSKETLATLSRVQVDSVMSALFWNEFRDSKWILKYLEEMVNYIPDREGQLKINGRAQKYYDFLQKSVDEIKTEARKEKDIKIDEEFVLNIIDYTKFIIAINAVNELNCRSGSNDTELKLNVGVVETNMILAQMMGTIEKDDPQGEENPKHDAKPAFKLSGIKLDLPKSARDLIKPKHTMRSEEKQLAMLLTWLLFYRVCEQDGISVAEVEQ